MVVRESPPSYRCLTVIAACESRLSSRRSRYSANADSPKCPESPGNKSPTNKALLAFYRKTYQKYNLEIEYVFTKCEILFGIPIYNTDFKMINYLVLLGKWYINQCKNASQPIFFITYIEIIKGKLECLRYTNLDKGIMDPEWQEILGTML